MSFAAVNEKEAKNWKPRVVVLGKKNRVEAIKRGV
jgi:aspartate 1-decarboxylase